VRILAIRKVNFIGDALFVFPTLSALRAKYPQAHIMLVSHRPVLPLAQAWGLADEVFDCEEECWLALSAPVGIYHGDVKEILKRTDCVIYWDIDTRGTVTLNLREEGIKDIFVAPETPVEIGAMHIADFMPKSVGLQALGIEHVLAEYVPPRWYSSNGFCLFEPPIAIHPGSTDAKRRWPARSFAEVINALLRRKYPVLLLSGPSEAETLQTVRKHIEPRLQPGMFSVLENAPLLKLAAQLQQSRFFLGNDSGIGHLAGLLGVPMLGLFGPTDPVHKRPAGPYVETMQEMPLEKLHPNKVLAHILQRL
jgi:heptosyltransferase-3